MVYDVLIVGGGPAGLTAGLYAARAGLNALLLEGGFAGGQASTTDTLMNYPGFPDGVGGPELMARFAEQAEKAGLHMRYDEATALTLDAPVKRVLVGGETIEAKAVILAMGAKRRPLGVPGEEALVGSGVSYCATCDGALYRGSHVALVGGGDTAVEDALYLARTSRVTLIHRRDKLRAGGRDAQRLLSDPNVDFKWNTVVEAMERDEGGVALWLKNRLDGSSERVSVKACFVAVGTQPGTALAEGQVKLTGEGYIDAGEDTLTSLPGVFAAGDVRFKPLKQVVTAVSDGAVAATQAVKFLSGAKQ